MNSTKLAALAALLVLFGTALLPIGQWPLWDDLSVGAPWPCSITGLSAAGIYPDGAAAGSIASTDPVDVKVVLCERPARRRMQTAMIVSLVAVGSVAVIERYRRSVGDGDASQPSPLREMRMTKAAALIGSFVLSGAAFLPGPQWLEEFELLSPELACPVTVLSATGVLPSSYDPGPNIFLDELDEARAECIDPARTRLVVVLMVTAIGVQSVAVFEYYRNYRRRNWEAALADQQDLFASLED